jgi:malate dehydrogenase
MNLDEFASRQLELRELLADATQAQLEPAPLLEELLQGLLKGVQSAPPLVPFLDAGNRRVDATHPKAKGAVLESTFRPRAASVGTVKPPTTSRPRIHDMAALGRIVVLGAGNIGGSLAQRLAEADLAAEVVLVDIVDGLPQGKALDIAESAPILGFSTKVTGSTSLDAIRGAEIVVETAGLARKPGMSRSDLLEKNAAIVEAHADAVRASAPHAVCLVVTNPVDVMTHYFREHSGLPPSRVFGESGTLDAARFRYFVAEALGVAPRDVTAVVLGTHGDTMVPLLSLSSVSGIPLTHLLSAERLQHIIERTKDGGAEVVNLLKTGSAYFAPTASQVELVRAIAGNEHRLLSASAHLDGPYGERGVYVGVPVVIGRAGVERILEVELAPAEKEAFDASVRAIRADLETLAKLRLGR